MQLRVLGDLAAGDGDTSSIGGPTQRRSYGLLVARRNETVSVDQLVDACWPDADAPNRAEHNVRTYVHRLRTALGEHGDRIETAAGGYRFRVEHDELDIERYERLAGEAERLLATGDVAAALDRIDGAEQLWRGRPYAELADEAWAVAEVARLAERRSELTAQRAEALLVGGRSRDAVAALERLVRDEPYRERPRALLMRALYESGRPTEALRAFQDFRRFLIDDAGVEPSPDLVDLDRRIAAGTVARSTPARRVGNYELHERIGEGAFAVVHRATQTSLAREVAVKIIRAELANRPEFIRRFEAEAQMVASIEHPNVVALYDFWREPGQAFLVMRWMTGGTLEQRLDHGPLELDATIELIDGLAGALDAAHARGIVHRDVKPANIFFDDSDRPYLGDFGIALAADERSNPQAALSEGSPVFASPEQLRREPVGPEADVHALGIVAFTALTGRTPFHDALDTGEQLRRQLDDPIPSFRKLAPTLPVDLDEVVAIATAKLPRDRYPTAGAFATAFRLAARGTVTSAVAPRHERTNPYRGLRAFTEADVGVFHGRARLVDELITACTDTDRRLLSVVGPSGSGKSSVVRAGLIPALRAGRVAGSGSWFITTMVPGGRPYEALETALLRVAVNPPAALLEQLRDGDRGIHRGVSRIVPHDDCRVLVVIDQFEELFTAAGEAERQRFLRALAVAVTEPKGPLRVVATMRADFFDQPLRHPEFAPLFKASTVAVTPLAPDEIEEAITSPAAAVDVGFEPGLVAEIIAEVNSQPGALPLLQYALTQVFDATSGDTIGIDAYRDAGGLTGALARRADALYAAADDDEQAALRRLIGRLVALGEGTDDTRRRVRRSELPIDVATDRVIERFGTARLLTFDHDASTREPTVEIAHEALLREWPRLREWLDDDRDALRVHRHLTAASTAWAASDRDPDELYSGARLASAETLLDAPAIALNPAEREFLDASIEHREAVGAQERRRVQRLRRLVAVTATVATIALVAGAVALWQRSRAGEEADRANAAAATAEAARSEAEREAAAAEAARGEADQQATRATEEAAAAEAARAAGDVQRLRSQAVAIAAEQPDLAALLAVEASRADPSAASDDALQRVLTAVPSYRGHIGEVAVHVWLAADGTTAAVMGRDVEIWDLATLTKLTSFPHGQTSLGTDTFAPDGSKVAFSNAGGTEVFDAGTGASLAQISAEYDEIQFSPDGSELAVLGNGGVTILDASTLERVDSIPASGTTMAWSPVADVVATSGGGTVQTWDMSTRALRWESTFGVPQMFTSAIAFSPDGGRVIVSTQEDVDDGPDPYRIRAFDAATGTEPFAPTSTTGLLYRFTPLDDRGDAIGGLIPGDFAAGTRAYDLRTGEELASPAPRLGAPLVVAYSSPLDLFMTAGNSGVNLWSRDGSSALETRIPLPDGWSASAGDNRTWTHLSADDSTLTVSNLDTLEHVTYDLTERHPSPEAGTGALRGFGTTTLSVTGEGAQLLDHAGEPLGPPVPVPGDLAFGDPWVASRDGRLFAIAHGAGQIELYRADGSEIATLQVPDALGARPTWISMSDDGSLLAAFLQGLNQAYAIWDTSTLEVVRSGAGFEHLRYFLSGDVVYASRIDQITIDRLDPYTFEPIGDPLIGHTFNLIGVTTDPVSGLVSTIAVDLTARLWDPATGDQIGRAMPFTGGNETRFSADGDLLVVPGHDSISLWNVDRPTWPAVACGIAGRNLTHDEWAKLGPQTIDYRATCEQHPLDE